MLLIIVKSIFSFIQIYKVFFQKKELIARAKTLFMVLFGKVAKKHPLLRLTVL